MQNSFLKHIQSVVGIPQSEQEKFQKMLTQSSFKKGEYFLKEV